MATYIAFRDIPTGMQLVCLIRPRRLFATRGFGWKSGGGGDAGLRSRRHDRE